MLTITKEIHQILTALYEDGVHSSNYMPDDVETLVGKLILSSTKFDRINGGDFDYEQKLADMVAKYMVMPDVDLVTDIMNYLVHNAIHSYRGRVKELLRNKELASE